MNADNRESNAGSGRRTFCRFCIGGMTAASAAMVGYPVVAFMALPERIGENKPLEVPLDQLAVGQAQYLDFQGLQVIVLAAPEGPVVFGASCPHLGCNVIWDAADAVFRCPCHGAVFGAAGDVVRGPVSAPLRKVPFVVKDGKIIVS